MRASSVIMSTLVVLLVVAVAPAGAATAHIETRHIPGYKGSSIDYSTVVFEASPGELNRVTLTGQGDTVVVRDDGAQVAPGEHCAAVDSHTVRCSLASPPLTYATLKLGDGDDRLGAGRPIGLHVTAYGGPGDDELAGGGSLHGADGADVLLGGTGNDDLSGGAGADRLDGAAGVDTLRGDGSEQPADDVLDGGAGKDTVSYAGSQGVTIDLRAARGGAPGESDSYAAIENATGGDGVDTIAGDDGPNRLEGYGGARGVEARTADRLIGRGGDDELSGSRGGNLLDGGLGNDELAGHGGQDRYVGGPGADKLDIGGKLIAGHTPQDVECGPGADEVRYPTPYTTVSRDCEVAFTDWYEVTISGLTARRPAFRFHVTLDLSSYPPCLVAAELAVAGTTTRRTRMLRVKQRQSYSTPFLPVGRAHSDRRAVQVRLFATDECGRGAKPRRFGGFVLGR